MVVLRQLFGQPLISRRELLIRFWNSQLSFLRRARTDFTSGAVQGDYTVFKGNRHLEILRRLNQTDYMFSDLVKVVSLLLPEMMLMRF